MKAPQDHWNNLIKIVTEKNPNVSQIQIDSMKLPFMIFYEMLSYEFQIENPEKIAEFAERLGKIFQEKQT